MSYRVHQIQVNVLIHDCQERDRDEAVVNSLLQEISDLATGDEIIVVATMAKEIGR
jgi:hypothetical protein